MCHPLLLVDADLDAPAIADRLGASRPTVDTHVQHVYRKFGVHSRRELEAMVREAGK